MDLQVLAYPFLCTAIFFESFILVTFLSKPAKDARARAKADGDALPTVAVIVPCYNEASTVGRTAETLLALDYPANKLEVILVNDGSTDGTKAAMDAFAEHPRVKVLHKANGGKHTALNAGIALTNADIVGCLDADSFVEPDALKEIVACFHKKEVAATTAAMSVHEPKNLLQHMQNAEYIFGITLRHSLSSVNGLYVTPGPFSFYRRAVVIELGGFRHGHQTEDLEMALRIQKAGLLIENAPRARVYTKAPTTVWKLVKQRTRWTTGFMRNILHEYRFLIGNRRHGALGMVVLPLGITAIVGGMLLFVVALVTLFENAYAALAVRTGIPLSYAYLPHHAFSFDWFYLPSSLYVLLGLSAILITLTLIVVGKRMSKTPGPIGLGIVGYALMYGLVAPLWLLRATADVAFGKERTWR